MSAKANRKSHKLRNVVVVIACAVVVTLASQFTAVGGGNEAEYGARTSYSANPTYSEVSSDSGEASNNEDASNSASVSQEAAGETWTQFDEALYPDYVRIVEEPVTIDYDVPSGSIVYSETDALGRTGRAVGNITYQMVADSAGWRSDFASDVDSRLAGWGHNGKCSIKFADGTVYNGYFWNRSHLIADSLGGYDTATGETPVENLITGTRTQNVGKNDGDGGMAYFETRTVAYLKAHQNVTVWYSAEPIYEGNELVPRSVYVKVLSSDGVLDMQGEVFNAAAGYTIDYTNGTFAASS